jgi:tetratricopeptide (TPR) repeat protein
MEQKSEAADEARIATLRNAVARDPDNVRALLELGGLLMNASRWLQAAPLFKKALSLDPAAKPARAALKRIATACAARGDKLEQQGQTAEAIASYRRAIALDPPGDSAWHLKIGALFYKQKNQELALRAWRKTTELDPSCVPAYLNLGKLLREMRREDDAITAYRKALDLRPDAVPAYRDLGKIHAERGELDIALEYIEKLLAIVPRDSKGTAVKSAVLERKGKTKEAYELILPLIRGGNRENYVVTGFGRICQRLDPPDGEAIPLLQQQLERPDLSLDDRKETLWTLIGLCDALQHYAQAFDYLEQVKALWMDDDPKGKRAAARRTIDEAIKAYTPERLARLPRATHGSALPIFIVGMARSGTTLAEQILASHPQVYGAGELRLIPKIAVEAIPKRSPYPQCLDELDETRANALAEAYLGKLRELAPDAVRVVDKMMFNFEHLGLIEILFPEARVIHCLRDPLDTCVSTYLHEINNMTDNRDLESLGRYYRRYHDIMRRWKGMLKIPIFTLRYEALLADPEPMVRSLVEFCGLPWDDACLQFHRTDRFVATFSYHQVRKPLYTSSVGRHRVYEPFLGPLKRALGDVLST